ncbi:MAG: SDR family NAD(P)-dependent oxidoreductase, partial [Candidatus Binatia bacterium]
MSSPRWQRALVTGASSGIGEAIARRLAAEGSELVLVARRQERLERLGFELRRFRSIPVEIVPADLTAAVDLERVEARLASAGRPVDLLVNNAGGGRLSVFPEGTPEDEECWARLNAISVLRLTAAALPGMRERARGTILNISSGAAFQPSPYAAVYGASKAFVNSFSQAIREESRRHGIVVTAVCPG